MDQNYMNIGKKARNKVHLVQIIIEPAKKYEYSNNN